jgi:hypothetical protein
VFTDEWYKKMAKEFIIISPNGQQERVLGLRAWEKAHNTDIFERQVNSKPGMHFMRGKWKGWSIWCIRQVR